MPKQSSSSKRLLAGVLIAAAVALVAWMVFRPAPVRTPATATPAASAPTPAAAATAGSSPAADFPAQLAEALALRDPRRRTQEFGLLLNAWIERDAEAALAYVRRLPPGANHTQGLLQVLGAIGHSDPDRALALARDLISNREQRAFYSALFARMAATDPLAAARRIEQVPAGESRDIAVRALADAWAQADLPAALDWAGRLPASERPTAMEAVLSGLSASDPLRAIQLAQENLSGAAFDRTLGTALQNLMRADLTAAAGLVGKLAAGPTQTQAALQIARLLAAQNPADALAWAKTLPAGEAQTLATGNILEVWAARDPVAAGQQILRMEAGRAQQEAALRLARVLAANPTQAISWAQSLPAGATRNIALANLASAWAATDPAAATRWAASLAETEVRKESLNGALSYWAARDAEAAKNFVLSLSGDTQASAAVHLAPSLAQQDPMAAVAWTQTLPTAEARETALIAAYARWLGNAPAAAQAWLAGATLPAATKARLAGLR